MQQCTGAHIFSSGVRAYLRVDAAGLYLEIRVLLPAGRLARTRSEDPTVLHAAVLCGCRDVSRMRVEKYLMEAEATSRGRRGMAEGFLSFKGRKSVISGACAHSF